MLGNWSGRFLREVGESGLCLEKCREDAKEVRESVGKRRKVRESAGKYREVGRKLLFRQVGISCSLAATYDY